MSLLAVKAIDHKRGTGLLYCGLTTWQPTQLGIQGHCYGPIKAPHFCTATPRSCLGATMLLRGVVVRCSTALVTANSSSIGELSL